MMQRKYIYEFIEDYQSEPTKIGKKRILLRFSSQLWASQPHDRVHVKTFSCLNTDALDATIGDILLPHNNYSYSIPSTYSQTSSSFEILKQRINNLYSGFCDSSVVMDRHTIRKMIHAHKLWNEVANKRNLDSRSAKYIDDVIMLFQETLKNECGKKIDLSWDMFKSFIDKKMESIFENYTNPSWDLSANLVLTDFVNTDHYAISYISSSLTGYLRNERLKYHNISRGGELDVCPICGRGLVKKGKEVEGCIWCLKVPHAFEGKQLVCSACGETYVVGSKSRRSVLCPACYIEYRKLKKIEYARNYRRKNHESKKNVDSSNLKNIS